MERAFTVIEETMNKSAITQFRNFTRKYQNVTKWNMCSDYCFDDKNKPNNVVSFVIFPYIVDFDDLNKVIEFMQPTDLKNCRTVSSSFCDFIKSGIFFSFNFVWGKNCILDKWKDKQSMDRVIQDYIDLTELWQETTPKNAEYYKRLNKQLKVLQNNTNRKSFNYKLLGRIVGVTFLASYLKYLLLREIPNIEVFGWFSDRDAITIWNDEIYLVFYQMISHNLISNKLSSERSDKVMDVVPGDMNMFYDSLNRVADFICGAISDFNDSNGQVTGKKQCKLIEDAIADNDYLLIMKIYEKSVSRGIHTKIID
ncbi:MAG: hypothetical protein J1E98_00675 [Lachnospiraceae bacterium]|nr:hypothetical protein [Lachnospiraceae bacterium]